jgi:hypothetical protein
MVKIDFSVTTTYGNYTDALYLPDDHTFTDAEIESIKQERVDNWLALIAAPQNEIPPEQV